MDHQEAQELLACLPHDRTLFPYCRDYYAVHLLDVATERYPTVRALKASPFGRLLTKPSVANLMKHCGDRRIDRSLLWSYWQDPGATYLLTAGLWGSRAGRYDQTSRPGYNLVLRLNFNHQHDHLFRQTLHPRCDGVFNGCGHPWLARQERPYYRETLAWSRLDIDLTNGEVLIEEVQSDWVREVIWLAQVVDRRQQTDKPIRFYNFHTTVAEAKAYLAFVSPLLRDWSQAMLAAAVRFCHQELGVDRLWYHTWETGRQLKNIGKYSAPPKSLYSQLPRQFCFQQTDQLPGFIDTPRTLRRLRRAKVTPRFYQLEL